jgi:hypothetical protein
VKRTITRFGVAHGVLVPSRGSWVGSCLAPCSGQLLAVEGRGPFRLRLARLALGGVAIVGGPQPWAMPDGLPWDLLVAPKAVELDQLGADELEPWGQLVTQGESISVTIDNSLDSPAGASVDLYVAEAEAERAASSSGPASSRRWGRR